LHYTITFIYLSFSIIFASELEKIPTNCFCVKKFDKDDNLFFLKNCYSFKKENNETFHCPLENSDSDDKKIDINDWTIINEDEKGCTPCEYTNKTYLRVPRGG